MSSQCYKYTESQHHCPQFQRLLFCKRADSCNRDFRDERIKQYTIRDFRDQMTNCNVQWRSEKSRLLIKFELTSVYQYATNAVKGFADIVFIRYRNKY